MEIKTDSKNNGERFKAMPFAEGFMRQEGISFTGTFSLVSSILELLWL